MLHGPTLLFACPACGGHGRQRTLGSGDTRGAVLWSDGYCHAPMLAEISPLVQCAHCEHLFWLEDEKCLGQASAGDAWARAQGSSKDSANASRAFLHIDRLEVALKATSTGCWRSEEEELYVRKRLWWRQNDSARAALGQTSPTPKAGQTLPLAAPSANTPPSQKYLDNLAALAALIPAQSPSDLVMSCEIARESGRFEDAQAMCAGLLGQVEDEWVKKVINEIHDRACASDRRVFTLN